MRARRAAAPCSERDEERPPRARRAPRRRARWRCGRLVTDPRGHRRAHGPSPSIRPGQAQGLTLEGLPLVRAPSRAGRIAASKDRERRRGRCASHLRQRSLIVAASLAAVRGVLAGPAPAARHAATHIVQLRDGVRSLRGRRPSAPPDGRVTGGCRSSRARRAPVARARARLRARPAGRGGQRQRARSARRATASTRAQLATAYPASVLAPQAWRPRPARASVSRSSTRASTAALPDFAGAAGRSRVIASVVTNPDARTASDTYGHGTHVAGIIAGDGTRRRADDPLPASYVGIAPDANLISIKAADDEGRGTMLDAIYGLQFAVDHKDEYNIRVVNLSLASTVAESYRTDPLDAAVESAYFHGILVVAAAGNRGAAADATHYSPGNDPFALTVGAVDDQGTRPRGDDAVADVVERRHDAGRLRQAGDRGAGRAHRLDPGAGQRVRRAVPGVRRRRQLHPARRHVDGGAGRRRRRRAGVRGAPRLDARPGQVDADRDRAATSTAASTRSTHRRARGHRAARPAPTPASCRTSSSTRRPATSTTPRSSWGRSSWGTARRLAGRRLGALELGLQVPGLAARAAESTRSSWGARHGS